jgi:ABC-type transport system involved in cytochrome c biogenesis permease component
MNLPLILNEFHRIKRTYKEILLCQGFSIFMVGMFSFILNDFLKLNPQIGTVVYWFIQIFSLILVSHSLFKNDYSQGFILNVLNSQTSLVSFLVSRWIVFTAFLVVSIAAVMPLFLYLLYIPLDNWKYFFFLLFPFSGIINGYGGLLCLFIENRRGYLLPFLLFPLISPLFILAIEGSTSQHFFTVFIIEVALVFLVLPFIIGLANHVLNYLNENY